MKRWENCTNDKNLVGVNSLAMQLNSRTTTQYLLNTTIPREHNTVVVIQWQWQFVTFYQNLWKLSKFQNSHKNYVVINLNMINPLSCLPALYSLRSNSSNVNRIILLPLVEYLHNIINTWTFTNCTIITWIVWS